MLAAAAAGALLLAGTATAQERLAFGTTNTASSHYAFAVAMSKSIQAGGANVNLTLLETGGSVDNVRRMADGKVALGITTSEVIYQAARGIGLFKEPVPNLRTMLLYTGAPMVIAVRADSGVRSIADLGGKTINPGLRGSSAEKMSELIYNTLGIEPTYFRGSISDALQATKDRKIVGFVKSGAGLSPDATLLELQTLTDITVLGFTDEQVSKVKTKYPYYQTMKIPANTYKGQGQPVQTFGFLMAIAIDAGVPAETGYRMIKAVVENKAMQEQAFAGAKDVEYVDFTLQNATSALHPGVAKYFKEIGRTIPADLDPKS